ncbi:DUF1540 domain-containing protein [uncultured Eubacterium sp.]|uniref:DUF1540 domain-containing protein n=1 Tax=uncultured Eubacterium sp. TaxID=165185 RepID=UPI00267245FE|nr:DUF1540 domain-containing protein [uncultured Eubacterium sp.]
MTKLNCSVKNCYYNKSSKCCREGIKVGGTEAIVTDATYCSDFREKRDSATSKTEHCDCGPENRLDIKCHAVNCTFNDNCKCHAEQITIQGNGATDQSQTECGSFECGCR